jgi:hypothetical protein
MSKTNNEANNLIAWIILIFKPKTVKIKGSPGKMEIDRDDIAKLLAEMKG